MPVFLHSELRSFKFKNKREIKKWISYVASNEGKVIGNINFIGISDSELLKINTKYLKRSTLTDVIAFNDNNENRINGDVFISIDRVRENAHLFSVPFHVELLRVMVHGTLHLIGYNDKSNIDKFKMTSKEDQYLKVANF